MPSDTSSARAWSAADVAADTSWVLRLTPEAADGIDAAVRHARAAAKPWLQMGRADFPLPPTAARQIAEAIALTQQRWGLCLIKGLPVERWSEDDARLACWGLGLHMGVARTQNRASAYMADVRNEGGAYKVTNGRGYNTNAGLDFHCDSCDVVGLLCRRQAQSGGDSFVVSSIALVDEVARRRPELVDVLKGAWFHTYQAAQQPGLPPYYECPIVDDRPQFALRANRKNVMGAQRDFAEVPRLTVQQVEVLDLMDDIMQDPKFCYSMRLEQGDFQLLNSYVTLHSRSNFVDFDEPDLKRHLLRLWLAVPSSQPLPQSFETYFGDVRAGAVRGGLYGSAMTQAFLDFERRHAAELGMPCKLRERVLPAAETVSA